MRIMGKALSERLRELKHRIAVMAGEVHRALTMAIEAVATGDGGVARAVCSGDVAINEQRFALEKDTVSVLATQQPAAGDLRLAVGILEITTELERMGDYAKEIARGVMHTPPARVPNLPPEIFQTRDLSLVMLDKAMQAFAASDAELATQLAKQDEEIDQLCQTLRQIVLKQATAGEPEFDEAIRLLPLVHALERFADRVTNICERVVYIATGDYVEFDHPSEVGQPL